MEREPFHAAHPTVRWFEPNREYAQRLALRLRRRSLFALVWMAFVLLSLSPLLVEALPREFRPDAFHILGLATGVNALLFLLTTLAERWITALELQNRIGTDGERVYLADFRGTVWSGRPQDLVQHGGWLAGGWVPVLVDPRPYKGRYEPYVPLYGEEEMRTFLGWKPTPKGWLAFPLHLLRNGYPAPLGWVRLLQALSFALLMTLPFVVFLVSLFTEALRG